MNHPYLVHHFLENSAARLPDKVALICGDQRLSYQQINQLSNQLTSSLIDLGINRQDRVIILLDNSAEAVIALFGILKAGAIFVMLNPAMKAKKLNYIIQDSGACAIITHTTKTKIIKDAVIDAPELNHIIWCTPAGVNKIPTCNKQLATNKQQPIKNQHATRNTQHASSHSWKELLSKPPSLPEADHHKSNIDRSSRLFCGASQLPAVIIDLDLATIIYTSGSTGEPKGVMSAHYNVVAAASSIATYLENVEDDIILSALPLSFDYGLYQILMAFLFGGTVVLEKSFV